MPRRSWAVCRNAPVRAAAGAPAPAPHTACSAVGLLALLQPAETFSQHEWLWKSDLQAEYASFVASAPMLEDCEGQLKRLNAAEQVGLAVGCARRT